jgi:integrase
LVELVASTGVRISEAIALQRRDLILDGSKPHLRIRRAIVRKRVEPPKSRHGRRTIPLPQSLVFKLRDHLRELDQDVPDALVFPSRNNTPLDPDNMRRRILKPILAEVDFEQGGWHSLRHTYASLQLARGVNVLQLSRALGHHSPSFTLSVYTHLLPGDEAPPLDLAGGLVEDLADALPELAAAA